MKMAAQVYVYGIVHADNVVSIAARPVGYDAGPVEIRRIGSLGVVVSSVADAEVLPVRRNTVNHTKVLEELLAARVTVLPMQFGVILDSFDVAEKAIAPREDHLLRLLEQIEGKIEVGITVRFKREGLFEQIVSERPDIGSRGRQLAGGDEVVTYHQRVAIGQEVEALIRQKNALDRSEILKAITPICCQHKELPAADDLTVLRSACLVPAADEPRLFALVEAFQKERDLRCEVRYLAPVPAYNFVRASLDWGSGQNGGA